MIVYADIDSANIPDTVLTKNADWIYTYIVSRQVTPGIMGKIAEAKDALRRNIGRLHGEAGLRVVFLETELWRLTTVTHEMLLVVRPLIQGKKVEGVSAALLFLKCTADQRITSVRMA